jgi:hypothetical protein
MPVRKSPAVARLGAALLLLGLTAGCGSGQPTATSASSVATPSSPAASGTPTPGGTAAASSADYNEAYRIGLEAYTYGLPLLTTNETFLTMTSVDVSSGAFGPVNQFNSVRSLNNPGSKVVVAPGSNGLSSIAWLDLTNEPQVLHVPQVTDHFFVLGLIDPYTTNIANLGTARSTKPGDYVIAGPGQQDLPIPAGAQRIDVSYTRIWIIGSTQLKGEADIPNVNRIQDGFTLTPLSQFGRAYHATPPASPRTTVTLATLPGGLDFFDVLGQQLKLFPPPAADQAELSDFAKAGIGPGMTPSANQQLSSDTVKGLEAAFADGPAQIKKDLAALFLADFDKHNGYLVGGFGTYGTNYPLRAVVTMVGLGAFSSDQAMFAMSSTDHSKQPLSGSTNYVMHMPSAPPSNEGWSLTVYNLQGALIPNSINRYQLSDASALTRNADGSVDIYFGANRPSDPSQAKNWLPTAGGSGFEVIWRLLAPKPSAVKGILDGTGWQPPAITKAP